MAGRLATFRRKLAATRIQRAYRKRQIVRKQPLTTLPKARIGASKGTFGKKGKKPKPITGVVFKETVDASVDQAMTAYWGTTYGSNRSNTLYALALHYCQFIARRLGTHIGSWTALVPHIGAQAPRKSHLKFIKLRFMKDNTDANNATFDADYTFVPGNTWSSLATWISGQFASAIDTGYYPMEMHMYDQDSYAFDRHTRMDQDMVTLHQTSYVRIQNITPADDGSNKDVNAVDANPLMGRVYDFDHVTPRLSTALIEALKNITGFSDISKVSNLSLAERHIKTNYLRNSALNTGTLANVFRLPPNGASVFTNCSGAKDVVMPPGGFYTVKRSMKTVASLKRIIFGITSFSGDVAGGAASPYYSGNVPIVQKSFMVALRPQVRTGLNEAVKLAINKDTVIKVSVRRAKTPNTPVYNNVVDGS